MEIVIGVDVGKSYLDIAWDDQLVRTGNTKSDIKKFLNQLIKSTPCETLLVVCEATGGYERLLVKLLNQYKIGVHVAHPNKIRAFAKSKGLFAKTDKIDARLIREYAILMRVKPDKVCVSQTPEKIAQALKRRQQLIDDRSREQARVDKEMEPEVKRSIQSHIQWLNKAIEKIDKLFDNYRQDEAIKTGVDLLCSIPGIGKMTALALIAFLPELGTANHKQLAALTGVAPFNRDSGKYRGKRFIQGGRAMMRKAIYMAAVASLRWNPQLSAFYQNLIRRGKPVKVALVAVMRKLIAMANCVIKRQSPWIEIRPVQT